jgi:hypothetical protein
VYRKVGGKIRNIGLDGMMGPFLMLHDVHDIFELVSAETEAGEVGEGPDTDGLVLRHIVLV